MMKKNSTITFYKFSNQYTVQWEAYNKKRSMPEKDMNLPYFIREFITYIYTIAPSPSDTRSATAYNSACSDRKSLHRRNIQSY